MIPAALPPPPEKFIRTLSHSAVGANACVRLTRWLVWVSARTVYAKPTIRDQPVLQEGLVSSAPTPLPGQLFPPTSNRSWPILLFEGLQSAPFDRGCHPCLCCSLETPSPVPSWRIEVSVCEVSGAARGGSSFGLDPGVFGDLVRLEERASHSIVSGVLSAGQHPAFQPHSGPEWPTGDVEMMLMMIS